jgi:two-component system nitrogen regulation response regulator GlnG
VQPTRLTTGTHPGTRILVVDDEENICTVVARTLAPLGYPVDIALDADSALEVMKEHRADVALVDIRMPGHDGVWLIERLQETYPATAIIIVTGMQELDPRLTLRPGVVSYLTKPFEGEKVREAVKKAIELVRSLPPGAGARALTEPVAEHELADLQDIGDEDAS